jgi:hypothetical protein
LSQLLLLLLLLLRLLLSDHLFESLSIPLRVRIQFNQSQNNSG